jgi:hypothetical protein
MIDHDVASYGHIVKLFLDGEPYGDLTRDDNHDTIAVVSRRWPRSRWERRGLAREIR